MMSSPFKCPKNIKSLYQEKTIREIAAMFDVSDSVVKRWLRENNISKRCRGPRSPEYNSHWKGGKKTHGGRVYIYNPDHYRSDTNGYVARYVLVWEKHHKKRVPKGYHVHHINGITDDDRPENLEAMSHSKHSRLHSKNNQYALGSGGWSHAKVTREHMSVIKQAWWNSEAGKAEKERRRCE